MSVALWRLSRAFIRMQQARLGTPVDWFGCTSDLNPLWVVLLVAPWVFEAAEGLPIPMPPPSPTMPVWGAVRASGGRLWRC